MKLRSRHLVILSLCYWFLRRLLEAAVLALRSGEAKEIEIRVLRHQGELKHLGIAVAPSTV